MIDKIAYEIIQAVAADVAYIETTRGLVKPMKRSVNGNDKIFPAAVNTPYNCDQSDYTALVPDSSKKAIAYVEHMGDTSIADDRNGYRMMEDKFLLVVWYNLDKITEGKYISVSEMADEFIAHIPSKISDLAVEGISKVRIYIDGIRYGSDLFSQYTYDEIKHQYLMHPYDAFGVMITVDYIQARCRPSLVPLEGCLTGKGNHETYAPVTDDISFDTELVTFDDTL